MSPLPAHRVAGVVLSMVALAGCSAATSAPEGPGATASAPVIVEREPSDYHGTLVDPPMRRPALVLQDTEGKRFSLADRPAHEVTVVFFGYTHCPDVCPTTMADLAAARAQLAPEVRDHVTVAFITEDPERDTPEVLRAWLDRIDPEFVGLVGGNASTKAALDELYLPQSTRIPTPSPAISHPDDGHTHPGDYGLEHAGIVYVFGPGGKTVLYTGGTSPRQYAQDLERLATQG
jgi:protein SCO1/2